MAHFGARRQAALKILAILGLRRPQTSRFNCVKESMESILKVAQKTRLQREKTQNHPKNVSFVLISGVKFITKARRTFFLDLSTSGSQKPKATAQRGPLPSLHSPGGSKPQDSGSPNGPGVWECMVLRG